MAKTQRGIIFATFIISCAAVVLSIISIATEEWVTGEIKAPNITSRASNVNYGLFTGVFEKFLLASGSKSVLTCQCIFSENVCAYSTKEKSDERKKEIEQILDGKLCSNTKELTRNTSKSLNSIKEIEPRSEDSNIIFSNFDKDKSEHYFLKSNAYADDDNNTNSELDKCDPIFLNAGLWIMTLFFLVLTILMGAFTAVLSVINTAGNPISQWFNIWGLYIWNGVAAATCLLAMIMWGAQFDAFISDNIGTIETLKGEFKNNGNPSLGYSYWLLFGSLFFYIFNIGLFYLREYLINREPPAPVIDHSRSINILL